MRKLPAVWLAIVGLGFGAVAQTPSTVLDAASLVRDGGFESKKFCPSDYNQQRLRTLAHWEQPTEGTPDHFASCSGSAGVPINRFGKELGLDGKLVKSVQLKMLRFTNKVKVFLKAFLKETFKLNTAKLTKRKIKQEHTSSFLTSVWAKKVAHTI